MKQIVIFLLVTSLAAGCNQAEKKAAEPSSASSQHAATIKQFYQYFNQHNWEKMAAMYADSAEMKDPALGNKMVVQTRTEIQKKYQELHQMIPDVQDRIVKMYHAGNQVIVEFISSGTAPDSSKFELPICTIFTLENGLIKQDFTYYDNF